MVARSPRIGTRALNLVGYRNNQKQWRLQDLEQRSLDNARVLWDRFMEKNRRDVEERAEQLKSIGNMAALIAGFAVVAFLEFSADTDTKALEIMFGLTTALVVCLLPQLNAQWLLSPAAVAPEDLLPRKHICL